MQKWSLNSSVFSIHFCYVEALKIRRVYDETRKQEEASFMKTGRQNRRSLNTHTESEVWRSGGAEMELQAGKASLKMYVC